MNTKSLLLLMPISLLLSADTNASKQPIKPRAQEVAASSRTVPYSERDVITIRTKVRYATLINAVDAERNSAARGFAILSLGRLATEDAVARLLVERQRTAALDRAWAWMALGLAARAGNLKARSALDLPLETKLQPGEHATSLVAIGLARQVGVGHRHAPGVSGGGRLGAGGDR